MSKRQGITITVLLASLLAGCGTSTSRYALDHGIQVDAVEIRMPTSTVPMGIVTQDGKVVGVVGGSARPLIDIPLTILGIGGGVAGGAILGKEIKSGLKSIESITPAE